LTQSYAKNMGLYGKYFFRMYSLVLGFWSYMQMKHEYNMLAVCLWT
jgi:hypothetical protein